MFSTSIQSSGPATSHPPPTHKTFIGDWRGAAPGHVSVHWVLGGGGADKMVKQDEELLSRDLISLSGLVQCITVWTTPV